MTDTGTADMKITAASDIEVDGATLDQSIHDYAGPNSKAYVTAFQKIHNATGWMPITFHIWAAILGPIWAASRSIWGMFWAFLLLETVAWVQIGSGAWGDPGADFTERAARQAKRAQDLRDRAAEASDQADIEQFSQLAANIQSAADSSFAKAAAAQSEGMGILVTGVVFLLLIKLVQGLIAFPACEKQYERWRIDPDSIEHGRSLRNTLSGLVLTAAIVPLIVYKFTANTAMGLLDEFPEDQVSALILGGEDRRLFSVIANWLEIRIDAAAYAGSDVFDGLVAGVRAVLDALTLALNGSPWPVVMLVICVTAWRAAGPRVAIFTAGSLAYIALLGYWEVAMETVALVGASVLLCVVIGIPLGIWFGKSRRAYAFAEPVLDLMQTLPAFVYLIPIIAFFGTGNPPGILATIIFGMPPVIRLTALGMRGVPDSIKEAAVAFGASRWQLLKDVEIPLALPSIMTGVNQTILMCLSMVVIISLIGGGGLGKEILESLQYAAKGPGLLGGFAILFLAMVMDRIVQGAFRRNDT